MRNFFYLQLNLSAISNQKPGIYKNLETCNALHIDAIHRESIKTKAIVNASTGARKRKLFLYGGYDTQHIAIIERWWDTINELKVPVEFQRFAKYNRRRNEDNTLVGSAEGTDACTHLQYVIGGQRSKVIEASLRAPVRHHSFHSRSAPRSGFHASIAPHICKNASPKAFIDLRNFEYVANILSIVFYQFLTTGKIRKYFEKKLIFTDKSEE